MTLYVLTTDASGNGWGAVLDNSHSVQGLWSQSQRLWHINALQLKAVELALWEFHLLLQGQVVLVCSDNATTCAYINKMGGTCSPDPCIQLWHMMLWIRKFHISLQAAFVPGVDNFQVNKLSHVDLSERCSLLSRHSLIDQREWVLNREVLQCLFLQLGHPQVDLFATKLNKQLPVFCSIYPSQHTLHQNHSPWIGKGFLGMLFLRLL